MAVFIIIYREELQSVHDLLQVIFGIMLKQGFVILKFDHMQLAVCSTQCFWEIMFNLRNKYAQNKMVYFYQKECATLLKLCQYRLSSDFLSIILKTDSSCFLVRLQVVGSAMDCCLIYYFPSNALFSSKLFLRDFLSYPSFY